VGTRGPLGACKRCATLSQETLERVRVGNWPIHAAPLVFQDWWHAALADGSHAQELERQIQAKNVAWYLLEATLPTVGGLGTDVAYAKLCELRGELDRRASSLQAVWIYLEAMGVTHGR
jgi:hypothetical protein